MQKIISLFQRNHDGDWQVRDEVTPGAEWVLAGEGTATRKWDGSCCMIRGGRLYKRREVKLGKRTPRGFEPSDKVDPNTGKQPGWVPVGDGPEDEVHREAFVATLPDGTYELCGPKIQGNPEAFDHPVLIKHGLVGFVDDPPRSFAGLKAWFAQHNYAEGIVWHHSDGRMVKLKAEDFGIQRLVPETVMPSCTPPASAVQ